MGKITKKRNDLPCNDLYVSTVSVCKNLNNKCLQNKIYKPFPRIVKVHQSLLHGMITGSRFDGFRLRFR